MAIHQDDEQEPEQAAVEEKPVVRLEELEVREAPATSVDPSLALGQVIGCEGRAYRVKRGRREIMATLDESVDPAVVAEAIRTQSRVVLEGDVIVGALVTAPALTVDREGNVNAKLKRFTVAVQEEAVIKTRRAFMRIRGSEIEHYAHELRLRAKDVARVLAGIIRLN